MSVDISCCGSKTDPAAAAKCAHGCGAAFAAQQIRQQLDDIFHHCCRSKGSEVCSSLERAKPPTRRLAAARPLNVWGHMLVYPESHPMVDRAAAAVDERAPTTTTTPAAPRLPPLQDAKTDGPRRPGQPA
ncbi:unnamed protein product [Heligmosomoides polygyrus]|uniref:Uncharacterized protein n=1 Tax=Heligmosomoides polygyrus TaxID=6339 RepID=A0A183GHD7_HELPZ|nr:unnamed protein product [Heligmosomoides polygyrus]